MQNDKNLVYHEAPNRHFIYVDADNPEILEALKNREKTIVVLVVRENGKLNHISVSLGYDEIKQKVGGAFRVKRKTNVPKRYDFHVNAHIDCHSSLQDFEECLAWVEPNND